MTRRPGLDTQPSQKGIAMHDTGSTTELATVDAPRPTMITAHCDVPTELADQLRVCEVLASATAIVPEAYRGSPGNVFAAMLHARTLDIPLIMALQDLYVTSDGHVGMSAALVHGLIVRAGHRVHVIRRDDRGCVLRLERWDDARDMIEGFDWDDAFGAGLLGRDNWKRYPTDMFYARALTRLARRWAVLETKGFAYTPEELDEGGDRFVTDGETPSAAADLVADIIIRAEDAATAEDVRLIAMEAKRANLLTQFTSTGERLRDVLTRRWRTLRSPAGVEADATDTTGTEDDGSNPLTEPVDRMPCGCLKTGFIAGGGHTSECRRDEVEGDTE